MDDVEQFATQDDGLQQVEKLVVLERADKRKNEGVIKRRHDLLFPDYAQHLVVIDELALADSLQSVRGLLAIDRRRQPDLPERTCSVERNP